MVLVSTFRAFFFYALLACIFFVGYSSLVADSSSYLVGTGCSNIYLLCAPIFYNNLLTILNHIFNTSSFIFLNLAIIFLTFSTFWLRIEKFKQRINWYKGFSLFFLLTTPSAQDVFALSGETLLTVNLFILISISFETINHGKLIRGILLASSIFLLLFLNGELGLLLAVVTPAFFYSMVKWHLLKKYTLPSHTLLLFPLVAIFFGVFYLNFIYNGSMFESFFNPSIKNESLSTLSFWVTFIPLFFIYYFKDKKGLNQIKRFIIPIFFLVNVALILLNLVHNQSELFGMCLICFSFEVISDTKFRKRSLSLAILSSLLLWAYSYSENLLELAKAL